MKILVGVTGFALFLYLVAHIAGNALIFFGPTVFNGYSHLLLSNPLIPVIEVWLAHTTPTSFAMYCSASINIICLSNTLRSAARAVTFSCAWENR